jgi:hypothetical protein
MSVYIYACIYRSSIKSGSAILLGYCDSQKAQLAQFQKEIIVELFIAIESNSLRIDLQRTFQYFRIHVEMINVHHSISK